MYYFEMKLVEERKKKKTFIPLICFSFIKGNSFAFSFL